MLLPKCKNAHPQSARFLHLILNSRHSFLSLFFFYATTFFRIPFLLVGAEKYKTLLCMRFPDNFGSTELKPLQQDGMKRRSLCNKRDAVKGLNVGASTSLSGRKRKGQHGAAPPFKWHRGRSESLSTINSRVLSARQYWPIHNKRQY